MRIGDSISVINRALEAAEARGQPPMAPWSAAAELGSTFSKGVLV